MATTTTYVNWLKSLPFDDSGLSECICPGCGTKGLKFQYFGYDASEIGWKLVWCDACKSGIRISRTKIPTTVQALIDESAQQVFLDLHSDIRLIA